MNFNLFNSLILAGVIQGFIFAFIWLFSKKYRAKSTYYLIALILVYSLSNLQYYLLDIGVFKYARFYDLYHLPLSLLMAPLLLLYGLSLVDGKDMQEIKKWLLFLPFILVMLLAIYYKYQLIFNQRPSGYSKFLDKIPTWGEFLAIAYSIIVILLLLNSIRNLYRNQEFSLSKISPKLNWFRNLLLFDLFAILLWTYSEIAFASENENYYYYPLWIVVALIIYWMGHVGIYKYGIDQERKNIRSHTQRTYSIKDHPPTKSDTIRALEDFLLSEKNFLDSQLTLEKTAEKLQVSQGHLSKLINTELQQSFKGYLNNLRVVEAKSHLSNPEFSNYTLAAIGLEAGFNSKSAFNASFKKITGMTPSQFKAQA